MHMMAMAMTVTLKRSHRVDVPVVPVYVNGRQALHHTAHQHVLLGCHVANQFTHVK